MKFTLATTMEHEGVLLDDWAVRWGGLSTEYRISNVRAVERGRWLILRPQTHNVGPQRLKIESQNIVRLDIDILSMISTLNANNRFEEWGKRQDMKWSCAQRDLVNESWWGEEVEAKHKAPQSYYQRSYHSTHKN